MKPIQMKENLKVADRIRKAINRLNTSSELMARAWFECFDNCREQGYVLVVWPIAATCHYIAFSECRNSDEIVVYCYENVQVPSNLPAKADDWKDTQYFRHGQIEQAASYILQRAERFPL